MPRVRSWLPPNVYSAGGDALRRCAAPAAAATIASLSPFLLLSSFSSQACDSAQRHSRRAISTTATTAAAAAANTTNTTNAAASAPPSSFSSASGSASLPRAADPLARVSKALLRRWRAAAAAVVASGAIPYEGLSQEQFAAEFHKHLYGRIDHHHGNNNSSNSSASDSNSNNKNSGSAQTVGKPHSPAMMEAAVPSPFPDKTAHTGATATAAAAAESPINSESTNTTESSATTGSGADAAAVNTESPLLRALVTEAWADLLFVCRSAATGAPIYFTADSVYREVADFTNWNDYNAESLTTSTTTVSGGGAAPSGDKTSAEREFVGDASQEARTPVSPAEDARLATYVTRALKAIERDPRLPVWTDLQYIEPLLLFYRGCDLTAAAANSKHPTSTSNSNNVSGNNTDRATRLQNETPAALLNRLLTSPAVARRYDIDVRVSVRVSPAVAPHSWSYTTAGGGGDFPSPSASPLPSSAAQNAQHGASAVVPPETILLVADLTSLDGALAGLEAACANDQRLAPLVPSSSAAPAATAGDGAGGGASPRARLEAKIIGRAAGDAAVLREAVTAIEGRWRGGGLGSDSKGTGHAAAATAAGGVAVAEAMPAVTVLVDAAAAVSAVLGLYSPFVNAANETSAAAAADKEVSLSSSSSSSSLSAAAASAPPAPATRVFVVCGDAAVDDMVAAVEELQSDEAMMAATGGTAGEAAGNDPQRQHKEKRSSWPVTILTPTQRLVLS